MQKEDISQLQDEKENLEVILNLKVRSGPRYIFTLQLIPC